MLCINRNILLGDIRIQDIVQCIKYKFRVKIPIIRFLIYFFILFKNIYIDRLLIYTFILESFNFTYNFVFTYLSTLIQMFITTKKKNQKHCLYISILYINNESFAIKFTKLFLHHKLSNFSYFFVFFFFLSIFILFKFSSF